MLARKVYKLIDVGTDGLRASLHRRDGVALSLQAYAHSHLGSETAVGNPGRTASVHSAEVAAEDEDLVGGEIVDPL